MGRAEDRKRKKNVSKKLTGSQFNRLKSDINHEYVQIEVESQMNKFRGLFSECFIEAVMKNNISQIKALTILDDTCLIMKRKIASKREKKDGES